MLDTLPTAKILHQMISISMIFVEELPDRMAFQNTSEIQMGIVKWLLLFEP